MYKDVYHWFKRHCNTSLSLSLPYSVSQIWATTFKFLIIEKKKMNALMHFADYHVYQWVFSSIRSFWETMSVFSDLSFAIFNPIN